MILEGLLVDLVPFNKRFQELEHGWRNNESWFWATVGERHVVTKASISERQEHRAQWREQGRASVFFGVQTKDGKPIGDFAMNWVVPHHRLSMLGAVISEPAYWGGGYGTDALLLVVDYAFDWLDFHKLWLATMSPNVRVHKQMEKVGFSLEARLREQTWVDGEWADILIYGLLREEWPGRPAMIEKLGLKAR